MEKIIRLKNLIEGALATYTGFYPVYTSEWENFAQFTKYKILSRGQMEGDTSEPLPGTVLKLSTDIKKGAAEYLIDFQRDFIEARNRAENSSTFLKKELERIEGLFSLPTYSVEFPVRVRDGKTQTELRIEKETFYYDFAAIEADLPEGRIKGESKHGVVSYLLATTNFYIWLKELAAQSYNKEPEEFRQIWLNPEEDIPKVFKALERAGFIDSESKWIAPDYLDNPGGIIDALKNLRPGILHNLTRPQLIEAFGKRLGFPYSGKRYEAKNAPYDSAIKKINKELDRL